MFRGLRLRLSLLYALAALFLVALVGGGAYAVVASYFRNVTDLALAHKMTHEFHALAAPLPPELIPADRDWSLVRSELDLLSRQQPAGGISEDEAIALAVAHIGGGTPREVRLREEDDRLVYEVRFAGGSRIFIAQSDGQILSVRRDEEDDDDDEHERETIPPPTPAPLTPLAYDAELAAIFVLPLDAGGQLLFNPNQVAAPLEPNLDALQAALSNGSDLRTVTAAGQRVRLLTYKLTRDDGPVALQLGRVLSDQERVLNQLTSGLLALGTLSMVFVGVGSWWMAGRALGPVQESWDRQQRFIASASHELRTPLTLIRASAEVALRSTPADDSDQRELLGDVLAESDHMRRLVDDLLLLSRLDSGKLSFTPTRIDLAQLLAEIQRQTARLGDERTIAVKLDATAAQAWADADRLRQVVLILIDNALRHTGPGGEVRIAARSEGDHVRIGISDTGCGIAPEHLPHIFERFYRVDPARSRDSGNAGLGLAIAQGVVTAMGGTIGAASKPGQGTTIWFTLPEKGS